MLSSFLIITLLIIPTSVVYGKSDPENPTKPCKKTPSEKCWTKREYEEAIRTKAGKINDTCHRGAHMNVTTVWNYLTSFKENHNFSVSGVSENTIRVSCNTLELIVCPDSGDQICVCDPKSFFNETLNMCQLHHTLEEDQKEIKKLLGQIENMTVWQYINESCEAGKSLFDPRRDQLSQIINGVKTITAGQECLFSKNLVCQRSDNTGAGVNGSKAGTCQCGLSTEWQPDPKDPMNLKKGTCAAEDGRSCELSYWVRNRRVALPILPCLNKKANCTPSHEQESDDLYYVCCVPGMTESEDDVCLNGQPEVKTRIWKLLGILSGLILMWSGMFG